VRIASHGTKGIHLARRSLIRVVRAIAQSAMPAFTTWQEPCSRPGLRVSAQLPGRHRRFRRALKHAGPVVLQTQCALDAALRATSNVVHLHGQENAFNLAVSPAPLCGDLDAAQPPVPARQVESVGEKGHALVEGWSVRLPMVATAVSRPRRPRSLPNATAWTCSTCPTGRSRRAGRRGVCAQTALSLDLEPHGYWMFAAARVDRPRGAQDLVMACHRIEPRPPLPRTR